MNKICAFWMRSKPTANERGFGALMSVLIVSTGTMAFSLVTLAAAASYSDAMFRREMRIQQALNSSACDDSASLMRAKDAFASGTVRLAEFDCDIQFSK